MKHWKWTSLIFLAASDALLVYFSFYLAYQIRFFFDPFIQLFPIVKGIPAWKLYLDALRAVVPIWLVLFTFWGKLYNLRFSQSRADNFLSIVKSVTLATLLIIAVTFLYRRYEYSRLVVGLCWFISIFLLFFAREFLKTCFKVVHDQIGVQEKIILMASGKIAEATAKLIGRDPHRKLELMQPENLDSFKKKIGEELEIDEVIVQASFLNDTKVEDFLGYCQDHEIEIKILPDFLEMGLGEILVDESLGIPVLHLKPLSLHGFRFFVKRLFDVSLSILIVSILFFPFLALCLCIILDSKGGIFFWQDRVGFKENIFRCLKFRTMHQNAEALLKEWQLASFRGGPAFKMKDDPRITKVGKWIRKFSLDELPQIWNVLKGEMSLIGPRPQVLAEAGGNPDWAKKRYRILPGITGLWQVSGRADLTYEDMMRLDIYYLENWSPGLDLNILLKTLPVVLGGKGAY